MKKKPYKQIMSQRAEAPIPKQDGLYCPFCNPSHLLIPGKQAACGTQLQVRAVQSIYRSRFVDEMVCVKCGKGGGEMAQYQGAFAHVIDCTPGVAMLAEPPKFSKLAGLVYVLPEWAKKRIEPRVGRAMPVDEVKEDGTRTGNVLGHFFYRGA